MSNFYTNGGFLYAAQLMGMKGWSRREESAWMTFATSLFPVPVSPSIKIVISVGAIFSMILCVPSSLPHSIKGEMFISFILTT